MRSLLPSRAERKSNIVNVVEGSESRTGRSQINRTEHQHTNLEPSRLLHSHVFWTLLSHHIEYNVFIDLFVLKTDFGKINEQSVQNFSERFPALLITCLCMLRLSCWMMT